MESFKAKLHKLHLSGEAIHRARAMLNIELTQHLRPSYVFLKATLAYYLLYWISNVRVAAFSLVISLSPTYLL